MGWQHGRKFYAEKKEKIGSTVLFIIPHIRKQCCWRLFPGGKTPVWPAFLTTPPEQGLPPTWDLHPSFLTREGLSVLFSFPLYPFFSHFTLLNQCLLLSLSPFKTHKIMEQLSPKWLSPTNSYTYIETCSIPTKEEEEFPTMSYSMAWWGGQLPWFPFFISHWQPGWPWTSRPSLLLWKMTC